MSFLERLFHSWERRLAFADDHERRVLPFEWGQEFIGAPVKPDGSPRDQAHRHVDWILEHSDQYFEARPTGGFSFGDGRLEFDSALQTACKVNDRVHARLFVVSNAPGPAVLVLPQWNAKTGAQEGLCQLLNRFGLSALKLALPYHEQRRPTDLQRADHTLSPNLGRTLQSCRQAVIDARSACEWLSREGFGPIAIVGTSLGSCVAFIAFAHEPLIRAAVFNHISPFFADVVWRGISTRQVREGIEGNLELDELRKIWMPLSPFHYYENLRKRALPTLLIHARFDLSFPRDLSLDVLDEFQRRGIAHTSKRLPCGHYTTGKFPFNWMDGLTISRFLARELR